MSNLLAAAVVVTALVVASCGDSGVTSSTSTTAVEPAGEAGGLILEAADPPPGTDFLATVTRQEAFELAKALLPGLSARFEAHGLVDVAASIFMAGPDPDQDLDFDSGDRVVVSLAGVFDTDIGAEAALGEVVDLADQFAADNRVTVESFPPDVPQALSFVTHSDTYPGGLAAVFWRDGSVVQAVFAQGGDPQSEVVALAQQLDSQ